VSSPFLAATSIVDWEHPHVRTLADTLRAEQVDAVRVAQRCFEWVRDEIRHTHDHGLPEVTCSASEVLEAGHGFCYAKTHLLAALLRANGIPTGFCYQRLALDAGGTSHCLHGLTAIDLPGLGWYRVDARGNRPDVDAQFDPPHERLAFQLTAPGETDLPGVWPAPLPLVVESLRRYRSAADLSKALPDIRP
jgi:transglutaminase-like putative cysteine protease